MLGRRDKVCWDRLGRCQKEQNSLISKVVTERERASTGVRLYYRNSTEEMLQLVLGNQFSMFAEGTMS